MENSVQNQQQIFVDNELVFVCIIKVDTRHDRYQISSSTSVFILTFEVNELHNF